MSDTVKNDRRAVQRISDAVARYADRIQEITARASRDMAGRVKQAESVAAERRRNLGRAERNLAEAAQALAGCRRDCGGLVARVRVAQNAVDEARAADARAQRAQQQARSAQHDLDNSLRSLRAVVETQSAAAVAQLKVLDGKLQIVGARSRSGFRAAAGTAIFVGNVLAAGSSLAQTAANAAQAAGVDAPGASSTLDEEVQRQAQDQRLYVWEEAELSRLRRDEEGDR